MLLFSAAIPAEVGIHNQGRREAERRVSLARRNAAIASGQTPAVLSDANCWVICRSLPGAGTDYGIEGVGQGEARIEKFILYSERLNLEFPKFKCHKSCNLPLVEHCPTKAGHQYCNFQNLIYT